MPTPAVGSLQLPLNQNLDTTSDSHGQAAFPQELLRAQDQGRGQVLPWHYRSFHKLHFIQGLTLQGESFCGRSLDG